LEYSLKSLARNVSDVPIIYSTKDIPYLSPMANFGQSKLTGSKIGQGYEEYFALI